MMDGPLRGRAAAAGLADGRARRALTCAASGPCRPTPPPATGHARSGGGARGGRGRGARGGPQVNEEQVGPRTAAPEAGACIARRPSIHDASARLCMGLGSAGGMAP